MLIISFHTNLHNLWKYFWVSKRISTSNAVDNKKIAYSASPGNIYIQTVGIAGFEQGCCTWQILQLPTKLLRLILVVKLF